MTREKTYIKIFKFINIYEYKYIRYIHIYVYIRYRDLKYIHMYRDPLMISLLSFSVSVYLVIILTSPCKFYKCIRGVFSSSLLCLLVFVFLFVLWVCFIICIQVGVVIYIIIFIGFLCSIF